MLTFASRVHCLYDCTPHLKHNFHTQIIKPSQSVPVVFTFYPRDAITYIDKVEFEINGLSRQAVMFTGQGKEVRVIQINLLNRLSLTQIAFLKRYRQNTLMDKNSEFGFFRAKD